MPGGGSICRFYPTHRPFLGRERVGVVCRAKRVRTAGWGRAGCSRRVLTPARQPREGRRWDRNRARAHLRVVDVQSTNGASVRAAAASKAAGLRLRRVRYFARLPDRGRGARTAAAPAWRPSWASTAAPAGGCFSVSRPILVIFACFFFCVLALWSFSTMIARANTHAQWAPSEPCAQHAQAEPQRAPPTALIGQAASVGRGRGFGANLAAFRGGRGGYGPPMRRVRPIKCRGLACHRCRACRRRRSGPSRAPHQ